jgi:hypothetical protein
MPNLLLVCKAVEFKEVVIGEARKLNCMDRFCYSGDVIEDGGELRKVPGSD